MKQSTDTPDKRKLIDRHPRAMGALIFAMSLGFAKLQIHDPLHAAEQNTERIWIWGSLMVFSICAGFYSLGLLVFGKRLNPWIESHPQNFGCRRPYMYLLLVFVSVLYLWVIRELEKQGYSIKAPY